MSVNNPREESDYKGQRFMTLQSNRTNGKIAQRPPVPIDPPSLTRIYKQTAQRVKLSIESLRSDAVYLLVCDEDKQVIAWFGSESDPEDREIALRVGLEIATKDYGNDEIDEIPVILEDLERSIQLRYFLDKLWEDEATYRGKVAKDARRKPVSNSPVVIYLVEKFYQDSYLLKEIKRALPNEEGIVPRVAFASVDKNTVVAVSVGDQWDLWIARGATAETDNLQTFLSSYIASQVEEESNSLWESGGLAGFETSQNIRVVMQGCERRLFRLTFKLLTDYEPPGRTVPYVPTREEINGNSSFFHKSNQQQQLQQPETKRDIRSSLKVTTNNDASDFDEIPTVPEAIGLDENTPKNLNNTNNDILDKKVKFDEQEGLPIINGGSNGGAAAAVDSLNPDDSSNEIPAPSVVTEMQDRKKNPGKYMLSQEALEFREEENVGPELRMELLEKSIVDPKILVGWQIEIDEGTFSGVRVITGTRKTLFSKTEYRLSRRNYNPLVDSYSSAFDDAWVRLKRLRAKGGLSFRPLRQVLSISGAAAQAVPIK